MSAPMTPARDLDVPVAGGSIADGIANKRQLGYALKRRIAALDREENHEEVARLTLEALYGDPIECMPRF